MTLVLIIAILIVVALATFVLIRRGRRAGGVIAAKPKRAGGSR